MWLLVLFDLPVANLSQIRAYSHFRKHLKVFGFEMLQKSVYVMFCGERDHADAVRRQVVSLVPPPSFLCQIVPWLSNVKLPAFRSNRIAADFPLP